MASTARGTKFQALKSRSATYDPFRVVKTFLMGWRTFTSLPARGGLRERIVSFLDNEGEEARRKALLQTSLLYQLHGIYRGAGIFRAERNEKAQHFDSLIALSLADCARDIRAGQPQAFTVLLQQGFEFGRYAVPPRHFVMREFLIELFEMTLRAPAMKYGLYPSGVLYSGGGKSHDEMARDFVQRGLGGGLPLAGGLIERTGPLEFTYDLSSTAYRSTGDLYQVRDGLKRWIRATGGNEERVTILLDRSKLPTAPH